MYLHRVSLILHSRLTHHSSFHKSDTRSYGNRSFYVVAVFEILANILISSFWKVVTFKGTHLVQRMSLLTLIILGGTFSIISLLHVARELWKNDLLGHQLPLPPT
jgi:low temperature requirement protein LtrA